MVRWPESHFLAHTVTRSFVYDTTILTRYCSTFLPSPPYSPAPYSPPSHPSTRPSISPRIPSDHHSVSSSSLFQARRGWHDQDDPVGDLRARMTPWAQKYVACQYAGCCRLGYEALAPTTTTANTDAGADVSGQATTTIRPHDSAPDWIRRTYDDLGNPYDDRGSAPPSSFDYGKIEKVRYADGSIVPVAVHRAQSSCPSGAWAMNVLVPGGRPCGPILYDRV